MVWHTEVGTFYTLGLQAAHGSRYVLHSWATNGKWKSVRFTELSYERQVEVGTFYGAELRTASESRYVLRSWATNGKRKSVRFTQLSYEEQLTGTVGCIHKISKQISESHSEIKCHEIRCVCVQGYKHTLRICNTYSFSTTTTVAQTRLNVTLYVHYLPC